MLLRMETFVRKIPDKSPRFVPVLSCRPPSARVHFTRVGAARQAGRLHELMATLEGKGFPRLGDWAADCSLVLEE